MSVVTDEDTPVGITLVGSDADGDALTVTATAPAHGTFTGGVYTPAANYFGPDSFSYTVDDGQGGSDTATVSITVRPVNDCEAQGSFLPPINANGERNVFNLGSTIPVKVRINGR